jgi:DNA-binding response OmpR family regulator
MKRILIIDDEESVLFAVRTILGDMGYEVETRSDPAEGEREALANEFDLILVDLRMPQRNGAEITETVRANKPSSNLLMITGYPSDPLLRRALDAGARGVVRKPFEIGKILEYLQ